MYSFGGLFSTYGIFTYIVVCVLSVYAYLVIHTIDVVLAYTHMRMFLLSASHPTENFVIVCLSQFLVNKHRYVMYFMHQTYITRSCNLCNSVGRVAIVNAIGVWCTVWP